MAVIFPKIDSLTIHGFGKIFNEDDFIIDFSKNLSILLGGNGLGKTTLLQCLVYALTGGIDTGIEDNKSFRWNHTYFKGRINDDAYVIVTFYFDNVFITIKRSFVSTKVLECKVLGTSQNDMRQYSFEQAICEYGNYQRIDDFLFLVNRLLYLPENRRSLLWDYDAQIRVLMIINNEFVIESEYSKLRQEIKEKDSNKRKIRWDIGRIEKQKNKSENGLIVEKSIDVSKEKNIGFREDKKGLLTKLQSLTNASKQIYKQVKDDENTLNILMMNISDISHSIQDAEIIYMQNSLLDHDAKYPLLFRRTLKNGYCPSCDKKSDNLQKTIVDRLTRGVCLICGEPISKHITLNDNVDLDGLNSQLQEKIAARNTLDVQINQNKNKLIRINDDISEIRNDISRMDYDYPSDIFDTDEEKEQFTDVELVPVDDISILYQKEKELEAEINLLTQKADAIFNEFVLNFQNRYDQLFAIYSSLASDFLGVPVGLKYIRSDAKFVAMSYLIPSFDGIERNVPETCSEAQRFFLDIAFKMSIINLNKIISNTAATFICETPENALDISYVNNVVKMFLSFIKNGASLLLTNNVQIAGIAQNIIKESVAQNIEVGIFDLLSHGKLSNIQSKSEDFIKTRDLIIAGALHE